MNKKYQKLLWMTIVILAIFGLAIFAWISYQPFLKTKIQYQPMSDINQISDIQEFSENLKNDRQKIRDYLANINNIDEAVEGVNDLNYFDQHGNAQKAISIGIYKNGKIISAATQLQPVHDIKAISDLEVALKQEHVLLIDDQYMYKTNVVYVGVDINEISELDIENLTYQLDFSLWFRFQGNIQSQNIDFLNAVKPITLSNPIIEKVGLQTRHLYKIKGHFKADFLPNHYAYKQHILGISFYHRELNQDNLIYVTDILGMGLTNKELLLKKLQQSQVLSPIYDWTINNLWFFQDITQKSSLGSIKYLSVQNATLKYSQFNFAIQIKENGFSLRRVIPPKWANYLLILSSIMLLFLAIYDNKFNSFPKLIWFFQTFCVFMMLLSGEVIAIDKLITEETNTYYLKTLITIFNTLWWIAPAFMINLLIKRFLWTPLEERTGRTIPNIVRLFMAFIVYLLAFFGIIAFVYEQPLTSLLATSGMVAMIIGLAIQVNISNIVSGIVINLERPFRVDDWIKVEIGKVINEGKVVDITWRTTRILTKDGYILSIPNGIASEAIVHNYNYPDKPCRLSLKICIDYNHSPDKVEKILLDAVLSADGILNQPEPSASFDGFNDWAAAYSVSFAIDNYALQSGYKKKVWKRIWVHLQRAGILPAVQRQEIYTFHGVKERGREESIKPIILLQEIDVFQSFSEENKIYLSERMRRHCFSPGEPVFKQGEAGDSLFILAEGVVSIWIQLENNKSIEVTRLGAGNFFGEIALLTETERTATVIAKTDSLLFEINKADIAPLIEKQPEVSRRIGSVLIQRQKRTISHTQFSQDSAADKDAIYKRLIRGIWNFFGLGKPV